MKRKNKKGGEREREKDGRKTEPGNLLINHGHHSLPSIGIIVRLSSNRNQSDSKDL